LYVLLPLCGEIEIFKIPLQK